MKIDMSGIRHAPKLLGRSLALKQQLCIGWSAVSVYLRPHDAHRALDVGDVIDRAQLRSRNAKPPLQLVQQDGRQDSADAAEVIFHPVASCDFNRGIDFLEHKPSNSQRRSCEQSSYAAQ